VENTLFCNIEKYFLKSPYIRILTRTINFQKFNDIFLVQRYENFHEYPISNVYEKSDKQIN